MFLIINKSKLQRRKRRDFDYLPFDEYHFNYSVNYNIEYEEEYPVYEEEYDERQIGYLSESFTRPQNDQMEESESSEGNFKRLSMRQIAYETGGGTVGNLNFLSFKFCESKVLCGSYHPLNGKFLPFTENSCVKDKCCWDEDLSECFCSSESSNESCIYNEQAVPKSISPAYSLQNFDFTRTKSKNKDKRKGKKDKKKNGKKNKESAQTNPKVSTPLTTTSLNFTPTSTTTTTTAISPNSTNTITTTTLTNTKTTTSTTTTATTTTTTTMKTTTTTMTRTTTTVNTAIAATTAITC